MGSSSLLWALGLVGIVFALLNFLVALFGAGFDPLYPIWIGGNLVVGVGLLVAAALGNLDALRERLSSGEARRAGVYGSSAVLGTVLTIVILGLLAYLAGWKSVRFDWSEQGVHSLTSQSEKVLDSLDTDVHVLALYQPLDLDPVRELLERYAYASDHFVVEYADPNERPELLARHGLTPEELGQGLVRISLGPESVNVTDPAEEKITNAIVKLSRTGEKKVYFLEGHNERRVEGEEAAERDGFGRAAEALRNENYRVEKLLLAARPDVPEDADVVVVAGATRPLLGPEHGALERYLARGGALLVLVDPRANTDIVDDLERWGVDVGDDIVIDRSLALFGRAATPFAARYDPDHEITRDMRETTLYHVARSVRSEGHGFTELVFTGDASWAERDLARFFEEGAAELDDADLPGPVPVAVAGTPRLPERDDGAPAEAAAPAGAAAGEEKEADEDGVAAAPEREPRLVVFGDADFASNDLIESSANRDLFVNSVNWLMGDVEAISIRPRVSRASRFSLSQQDALRIRLLSLFVLPEAIAVIGVFVWWSRRRSTER